MSGYRWYACNDPVRHHAHAFLGPELLSVCNLSMRRDAAERAWTTQRAVGRLRCWSCRQAIARDDLAEAVTL